jgi:hypothetical protein
MGGQTMKRPPIGWYILALVIGAPFALAGIVLLIPPFTPVGMVTILISGFPFYWVEKRRLKAQLADHPLENGIEKPWE